MGWQEVGPHPCSVCWCHTGAGYILGRESSARLRLFGCDTVGASSSVFLNNCLVVGSASRAGKGYNSQKVKIAYFPGTCLGVFWALGILSFFFLSFSFLLLTLVFEWFLFSLWAVVFLALWFRCASSRGLTVKNIWVNWRIILTMQITTSCVQHCKSECMFRSCFSFHNIREDRGLQSCP